MQAVKECHMTSVAYQSWYEDIRVKYVDIIQEEIIP